MVPKTSIKGKEKVPLDKVQKWKHLTPNDAVESIETFTDRDAIMQYESLVIPSIYMIFLVRLSDFPTILTVT